MLELLRCLQGRHLAARSLKALHVAGAWCECWLGHNTSEKLFLRLHISPRPHYLSALSNIFPAVFNLVCFHCTIGGGAVGKADKLFVPGSIISL